MITSYQVGAVFRLIDEVSPALRLIGETMVAVEKSIVSAQKALRAFGETKTGSLSTGLEGIATKFRAITTGADAASNGITRALQRADEAVTATGGKVLGIGTRFSELEGRSDTAITGVVTNLGRADAAIAGTTGAVERLRTALSEAGTASREISGPRGGGSGGGPPPGPESGGGSGGEHGRSAAEIGFNVGMLGTMGFHEVVGSIETVLHHASDLTHVQVQMEQGGMKSAEVAEATAEAWKMAGKYGLDVSKVMEDIKELRFPFGSTEHAIGFIEPLEQMRVVLNSVAAGRGNDSANSVYEMARAGELKGLQKPEEFLTYFDDMTKVISATGGKVTPKDFMQAMKYGRVASLGWDEEFTTKYLPTLMQSLGPSGAGTASMSLFGTLAQGKVTKRSLGQMEDLGLIGDYTKIIYDKKGDPAGFNPGAIKDTDEFVKNPALWAQHTLLPLLEKKYGALDNETNRLHAGEEMGGLFGNRMSAQAIAEFILRMQSINKDVNLIGEAHGIGGANTMLEKDPTAVMNKFSASWSNLLSALGGSSVQTATDAMNGVSSGLTALSRWAEEHPTASKLLLEGMTAIGIALGVLTAVGVVSALALFLPGGAFAVGAAAVVGVIGSFLLFNWSALKSGMDILGRVPAAIGDFLHGLINKLRSIPGMSRLLGDDVSDIMGHPRHPDSADRGVRIIEGAPQPDPTTTMFGGAIGPMAYRPGENSDLVETLAQGVFRGLKLYAMGGAADGAAGGGGFTNAAYTSWDSTPAAGRMLRGGSGGAGIGGGSGIPATNGTFGAGAPGSAVDLAAGMMGWHEQANRGQVNSFLNAHGQHIDAARTAWCAAFINANLAAVGIHGTGSLAAASFAHWGRPVGLNDIHKGDVILKNHHVGFATGEVGPHGEIGMISGNHGDRVGHSWERAGSILGVRRAQHDFIPPRRPSTTTPVHTKIHLDGKIVAESVTHHQMAANTFTNGHSYLDDHAHFHGPDTAHG